MTLQKMKKSKFEIIINECNKPKFNYKLLILLIIKKCIVMIFFYYQKNNKRKK